MIQQAAGIPFRCILLLSSACETRRSRLIPILILSSVIGMQNSAYWIGRIKDTMPLLYWLEKGLISIIVFRPVHALIRRCCHESKRKNDAGLKYLHGHHPHRTRTSHQLLAHSSPLPRRRACAVARSECASNSVCADDFSQNHERFPRIARTGCAPVAGIVAQAQCLIYCIECSPIMLPSVSTISAM